MAIKDENEMVNLFCEKYEKRKFYREIPFCMRSVDLVYYDEANNQITAIEFKVADWKTAIKQLIKVSFCFDKLVMCINEPKRKDSIERITKECNKYGIGLYLFKEDNSFDHSVEEESNNYVWDKMKESIIEYIENM